MDMRRTGQAGLVVLAVAVTLMSPSSPVAPQEVDWHDLPAWDLERLFGTAILTSPS